MVEIKSLTGSPAGTYQMALGTTFSDRPGGAFQGGVNVGGFISRDPAGNSLTGFVAFCVSEAQNVNIRTLGGTSFGEVGAGDLILTLLDAERQVIRRVDNAIPTSTVVRPPEGPDLGGVTADIVVDAQASSSGNGTFSSPFRSITEAARSAGPGDVILVRAGVYSPSSTDEAVPLEVNSANVTILGSGAATTIIDAERQVRFDNNGNAVVLAADGIRFSGFTVRNSDQIAVLVFRSSGVRVDKNFLTSNGRFGFGAIESPGLIVTENVAVANQESGLVVSGSQAESVSFAPEGCPPSFGACVIDNIANDNRADGILGSAGGDLHIISNTTNNNGSSGIELNNRADPEQPENPPLIGYIKSNSISNNGGVQFAFAGTGILVTEGALAQEISDNQLVNNRPFGIGIFLNGFAEVITRNTVNDTQSNAVLVQRGSRVTEISDNTITNSGLSGLFVENDGAVTRILRNNSTGNGTCTVCTDAKAGLAVLAQSVVEVADGNVFDRNAVGVEVAGASRVDELSNSSVSGNDEGGLFLRESSVIGSFGGNTVRTNRGLAAIVLGSSEAAITNSEISANRTTGILLLSASTLTLSGNSIENNEGQGGVVLDGGSTATLTGGNTVTGNSGVGLSAQNGGRIECQGQNTVSGNIGGDVMGNVSGCP